MIKFDVNDFLTFDLIPDWAIFVMYPEKRYLHLQAHMFHSSFLSQASTHACLYESPKVIQGMSVMHWQ